MLIYPNQPSPQQTAQTLSLYRFHYKFVPYIFYPYYRSINTGHVLLMFMSRSLLTGPGRRSTRPQRPQVVALLMLGPHEGGHRLLVLRRVFSLVLRSVPGFPRGLMLRSMGCSDSTKPSDSSICSDQAPDKTKVLR